MSALKAVFSNVLLRSTGHPNVIPTDGRNLNRITIHLDRSNLVEEVCLQTIAHIATQDQANASLCSPNTGMAGCKLRLSNDTDSAIARQNSYQKHFDNLHFS
jgi:hypothetical protein